MKLKAAFIFIFPAGSDPGNSESYQAWTKTPTVDLLAIGVTSYEEGVKAAKMAVNELGVGAIELCGGFGLQGAAMVAKAVSVPVGVVRFDVHPGLGNVSGDSLFAK